MITGFPSKDEKSDKAVGLLVLKTNVFQVGVQNVELLPAPAGFSLFPHEAVGLPTPGPGFFFAVGLSCAL